MEHYIITSSAHIMPYTGLIKHLQQAIIITTGAHLNARKWKDTDT